MTQQELVGVDISFEKNVIESGGGVRQRALAIQALVGMAERLDAQVTPELVEKFRGLTKKQAILARKSLENLVQFFGEKPVQDEAVIDTPAVEVVTIAQPQQEAAPASEVFIDDEPEDFTAPVLTEISEEKSESVIEIQGEAEPLNTAAQKWLSGLIDDDVTELSEADIPRIVENLMELRGPMPKAKLDYRLILTERLKGQKQDVIAELVSSTHSSISLTLNNFRNHILKTRSQDVEPAKELTQTAKPIPKPPLNPAAIRPILSVEKPVVVEVIEPAPLRVTEQSITEIREERLEKLIQSVEKPNNYSPSEWLEIAEEHIRDVASDVLAPEQVDALWQHIHFDDEDQYKLAPAEYQTALESLRSRFRKYASKTSKMSDEQKALRTLFNVSMGYKNLDDVHQLLSRSDVSVRPNWVQRVVVAGFAMVVEEDE